MKSNRIELTPLLSIDERISADNSVCIDIDEKSNKLNELESKETKAETDALSIANGSFNALFLPLPLDVAYIVLDYCDVETAALIALQSDESGRALITKYLLDDGVK